MSKLILVRHATTKDNIDGNLSGHIDSELSNLGKQQILKLNKFLEKENIDCIYTTTSTRTKNTIKDIAKSKNLDIVESENLREISFGDFEGMDFEYIKNNFREEFEKIIKNGFEYKYPNGESLVDSYNRVCKEINYILDCNKDKTILICAHAGTIRNIISYLIGNTHEYHWNFKIDNASVSIIDIVDGFSVIHTLNNTLYLT
ncbi:histidine phosphatase [Paraclostridium benzoelyticum]|uniref:phosphoglycerate mutase (2,3-diphosphoglycerate-dependent) n=1 Tax=Paraclostridium benzoelyticum TaxID=1629550 RepID=A0A0M3DFX9_9FIRM|nr:histidine phosphatase family protein [Paraclostridium benzoelyticum]KKY01193.1 histidine phosphatase [Paraclostridium benzoelyticum]